MTLSLKELLLKKAEIGDFSFQNPLDLNYPLLYEDFTSEIELKYLNKLNIALNEIKNNIKNYLIYSNDKKLTLNSDYDIDFNQNQITINDEIHNNITITSNNSYKSYYMELIDIAIIELGITNNNQPPKKIITDFLTQKAPELSNNIINYLATIIRTPESQKGGYWKG